MLRDGLELVATTTMASAVLERLVASLVTPSAVLLRQAAQCSQCNDDAGLKAEGVRRRENNTVERWDSIETAFSVSLVTKQMENISFVNLWTGGSAVLLIGQTN
jgi:hypothetical protein